MKAHSDNYGVFTLPRGRCYCITNLSTTLRLVFASRMKIDMAVMNYKSAVVHKTGDKTNINRSD